MYLKYLSHRWELKKSHHNIVTPPSPRHWISSEVVSVWDFSTGSTVIQWLVTWFELGRCYLGLSQSKWVIWLVISTQLVKWENTTRRQKENENMLTRRSNILVNLIFVFSSEQSGKNDKCRFHNFHVWEGNTFFSLRLCLWLSSPA